MKTITLIIITLLAFGLFADVTPFYEGELIVQIKGSYQQAEEVRENLNSFIEDFSEYSLKAERELTRRMRIWLVSFDDTKISTRDFLVLVKQHPSIEKAQYNHEVELRQTFPDDQQFSQQWALHNTGQGGGTAGADIDAALAWDITTGGTAANGREIVIAIVDNGFDLNHPDIDYWKNLNEIPGSGNDDDGNGYIDDYDGWNAYNNSGNIPSASHGTHVAGIAAAIGNNALGVSGVNWGAKIMPIAGSSSNEAIVIAAYGYVLEMRSLFNETDGAYGAYVVATNASFGVNYGQPANFPLWGAMYDTMGEEGILSAAATMNINANVDNVGDVPTAFPSPYLLSVTNTTNTDQKNTGAAFGLTTIDIGAPGTQIYSTVPGGGYSNMTGTSMASPHVAGAIALMYAAAPINLLNTFETQPGELALIFKDILIESVDVIPALENITVSGGRLNLHNALQMVLDHGEEEDEPAPFNLIAELIDNEVVLSWDEHDYRNPQYYIVQRNGEVILSGELDNQTYTDATTYRGYFYEYQISAGYDDPPGVSDPSNIAAITLPPAPPLLVSPENGSTVPFEGLELEWENVYGEDFYTLAVAYDLDFEVLFINPVNLQTTSLPLPALPQDITLYWRVSATNIGGTSEFGEVYSFTTETETSLDDSVSLLKTGIQNIHPNPFSPLANTRSSGLKVELELDRDSRTALQVYNVKGQLIKTIIDTELTQGRHSIVWDGSTQNGREVGNGIYFIRFATDNHQEMGKVLLIR